jgi:hypothetical protein
MQCEHCNKNSADLYCFGCKNWLCYECANKHHLEKATIYTCKKCKGECRSREEIEILEQTEKTTADFYNYGKQFVGVFVYPFRGEGPLVLLIGVLVFGFLLVFSAVNIVLRIIVMPFIALFVLFYMAKSMSDSVVDDSPKGVPDVLLDFGELVMDMLRLAVGSLLCFIPAIFVSDQWGWLFWLFVCCGVYFLPMAWLMAVLENEIWIFHPQRFFQAILRTIRQYSVIPFFWSLLFGIGYLIEVIFFNRISIWGYFFQAAVLVYFIHVSMRPLGLFYRVYERDLGFTDHQQIRETEAGCK